MRIDLGAQNVLVLDHAGQLLTETASQVDVDVQSLIVLLGNAMAAANEVTRLLEGGESFELNMHRGRKFDIYTAQITPEVFLSLIVDRENAASSAMGLVWLSVRRAVGDLRELLAQARTHVRPSLGLDLRQAFADGLDAALGLGPDSIPSAAKTPPPPAVTVERKSEAQELKPAVKDKPAAPEAVARRIEVNPTGGMENISSYAQAREMGLVNFDDIEEQSS
ncbi:MAG: hypothetical protein WCF84_12070 [Anaerolineae bacterium]